MSLCRIVGADFDTAIEATDTAFVTSQPDRLSAETAARPELHLLEKQVAAGKEQIRMARADMLPTVGLSVGYSYYGNIKLNGMTDVGGGTMKPYSQEFRDGMGLAMLAVKIPIFHWGENRKKYAKHDTNCAMRNSTCKKTLVCSISRCSRRSVIYKTVTN